MLERIVEFALSQRLLVLLSVVLIAVAGLQAFRQLPIDAFPDISPTQVKLILKAPGMTPEEVESRVIVPLEYELLGIPRQTVLRSAAKYAIADLTIDFEEGTDIYWARQQVAERLANVAGDLPAGVAGGLAPIATPLSDLFMFTVEGGGLSLEERRTLLDWTIRPALRTLPGVADVNSLGGRVRTLEVVPDRGAMALAGVTVADLEAAISRNNGNDGAGRLDSGEEALVVRAVGAIQGLDDLATIVVRTGPQGVVRVRDIAAVQDGTLTRYGAVTKDGEGEAVQGLVIGLRGADSSKVVARVKERLAELQPTLPPGVSIDVFYDRSALIERAVGTVTRALVEAAILVVVLLLVFLGEFRAALVVATTLPLSALLTFVLMRTTGLSANLMSLGGLAIAIGMLVDAAVVVVENTVSRLQVVRSESIPKLHVVYRAVAEVTRPVAAGILIICLVFLPLLTLQGLEGKLFAPVALTIIYALSASLLLALTVIPVLASFVLKAGSEHEPWLMRRLLPVYDRALEAVLARPRAVAVGAALAILLTVVAYAGLGKTFMPTMDEGAVLVQTEKLPSINLEASIAGDLRLGAELKAAIPEVQHTIARVGSDELGFDPMGLNQTDMFLVLAPKDEWEVPDKEALMERMRAVLDRFVGTDYAFTQPIEMRVSEMLTGARGDLAVKIFGPDLDRVGELAAQIETVLRGIDGAEDVYTLTNSGVQYLALDIDRLAAGRAGFDVAALQAELRAQVEGLGIGSVLESGRRIPIVVRGDERLRRLPDRFADLRIAAPAGGTVRIGDLAQVSLVDGPVKVDRENASRFALVQANVAGRDLVGYVEDAQSRVSGDIQLPPGYRIAWGGQFENQQRAAARLALVVPVAVGLIFLVLFSTFGSVRQALLVLANVPFALVGGVLALWLAREYMSVPASVGFIALLGIAVLNALVMVSHFNHLGESGVPIERVVREGARRRLRPVLMTASITAFGLVPLLFASGPGSEIQRPLAIVVIGGLVTSTVLTLLILPLLYLRFGSERLATGGSGR
jgi:cobalt-zinc-cadmium resistance protein CzcA